MRRLQGSEATSCNARWVEIPLTDADSKTNPALFPELVRNHATPWRVGTERENREFLLAVIWKLTVTGDRIRFWNLSNGKTTPLMESYCFTIARDGCAKKL